MVLKYRKVAGSVSRNCLSALGKYAQNALQQHCSSSSYSRISDICITARAAVAARTPHTLMVTNLILNHFSLPFRHPAKLHS